MNTIILKKLLGIAFLPLVAYGQEPAKLKAGTWRLNLEKSKFGSGLRPRSDTRVYKDEGGGLISSVHTTIDAQGNESVTTYSARFDGKEYPVVTRGSAVAGSIVFTLIDEHAESFVLTRGGKVAVRGVTRISNDGKTLTM